MFIVSSGNVIFALLLYKSFYLWASSVLDIGKGGKETFPLAPNIGEILRSEGARVCICPGDNIGLSRGRVSLLVVFNRRVLRIGELSRGRVSGLS